MAGVCPNQILSGHTAIVSHDHCSRGSVANYGGRCPVGQRLVSTRVEGRVPASRLAFAPTLKILRPP